MPSYLERYLSGEYGQVSQELTQLGELAEVGPMRVDAYEVLVPSSAADALLVGHPNGLTFVEYIRLSCRWADFPAWNSQARAPMR